jgi:hypothetical protein
LGVLWPWWNSEFRIAVCIIKRWGVSVVVDDPLTRMSHLRAGSEAFVFTLSNSTCGEGELPKAVRISEAQGVFGLYQLEEVRCEATVI